jgi:hypothetical protein
MYPTLNNRKITLKMRYLAAFVLLPVVFLTACDSTDPEPDPDVILAAYDTTTLGGLPTIVVEEPSGQPIGIGITTNGVADNEITWTNDFQYLIRGRVFVNDGQELTIEPGTVIKGAAEPDPDEASVLVVARGCRLIADGTAQDPIIFTAEADDVSDPDDLASLESGGVGLWGGLIVLGRAPTNNATDQSIEGIVSEEERGQYGGNDPEDDSGIIRYVSIRHGGTAIAPNNEINGLTMGAVGRGTVIDYVEVYNNQDDGFEWFGGTVDAKHLIAAFVRDDSFDMDQGYTGRGQFFFAVQAEETGGGHACECDGAHAPAAGPGGEGSEPYATATIYNATYIGSGQNGDGGLTLSITDNFAGSYYNSIFIDFPGKAILIEDLEAGEDSRARFEEETLNVENNIFWSFGAGATFLDLVSNTGTFGAAVATYLTTNNDIVDPELGGIAREAAGLDPIPAAGSPAASGAAAVPAGFYDDVDYIGAFEPGAATNWADGWTFISQAGWLE